MRQQEGPQRARRGRESGEGRTDGEEELSAVRGEALGEVRAQVVRRLELGEVVVDAVVGRDGERAALPDAAAKRLAEPLDLLDELARADEDAADGRAEALGQAQRDRVERAAQLLERHARLGGDLPHARAVAVHDDAVRAHAVRDADDLLLREHHCEREGGPSVSPGSGSTTCTGRRATGAGRRESEADALPESVFSSDTSLVGAEWMSSPKTALSSTSSSVRWWPLRGGTACDDACECMATPPASYRCTCERASRMIECGGCVRCVRIASWFVCGRARGSVSGSSFSTSSRRSLAADAKRGAKRGRGGRTMVPETQNRPASLPAILAILSCRSLVAWSSCAR